MQLSEVSGLISAIIGLAAACRRGNAWLSSKGNEAVKNNKRRRVEGRRKEDRGAEESKGRLLDRYVTVQHVALWPRLQSVALDIALEDRPRKSVAARIAQSRLG